MVTINTVQGSMEGVEVGDVLEFRGIRYAEPPVGELRFRPPVRTGAWAGTYDATTHGNRSVQNPQPAAMGPTGPGEPDEDCLFLNVTTPAADGAGRPVLCWIHGGAFTIGSGNDYPAQALVEANDVVVVTVNYRLGLLGFLDLSGLDSSYAGSANNGIADQIAALEWIRDHIADFGGDPGNVTIAGESAGAISVLSLLASPAADGLYAKAMANSAGGFKSEPVDVAAMIAASLPGEGTVLDRALTGSTGDLLAAQMAAGFALGSTIDGTVVQRGQDEAIRFQSAAGIPLVIGSNGDEGTLFHAVAGFDEQVFDRMTAALPNSVTKGGSTDRYLELLDATHPDNDLTARNLQVWNDYFRRPAVEGAAAATEAGAGGWLYRFALPTHAFDGALGVAHASEIAFTFNWFAGEGELPGWTFHDRTDTTCELAAEWSATVAQFMRTGDPNGAGLPEWPRYASDDRRVLVLGDPVRVEVDPDEVQRKIWSEI